ncbi:hypothetical protein PV326_003171 [Microctonus aethiopoides]|nr:hypothetical protein PV326_003171 [Microctonus aethiopoides]
MVKVKKVYNMKKCDGACVDPTKCLKTITGSCRKPSWYNIFRQRHKHFSKQQLKDGYQKLLRDHTPESLNQWACTIVHEDGKHFNEYYSKTPSAEACHLYNSTNAIKKIFTQVKEEIKKIKNNISLIDQRTILSFIRKEIRVAHYNKKNGNYKIIPHNYSDDNIIRLISTASENEYKFSINLILIQSYCEAYKGLKIKDVDIFDFHSEDSYVAKLPINVKNLAILLLLIGYLGAKHLSEKLKLQDFDKMCMCYLGFNLNTAQCDSASWVYKYYKSKNDRLIALYSKKNE